jgi:hypothetical protein
MFKMKYVLMLIWDCNQQALGCIVFDCCCEVVVSSHQSYLPQKGCQGRELGKIRRLSPLKKKKRKGGWRRKRELAMNVSSLYHDLNHIISYYTVEKGGRLKVRRTRHRY